MLAAALAALAVLSCARAANPIVPNVGMADPHIHLFNGVFYLYATHDFAPNNTGFRMDNWWVWASPDLVRKRRARLVSPAIPVCTASTVIPL